MELIDVFNNKIPIKQYLLVYMIKMIKQQKKIRENLNLITKK